MRIRGIGKLKRVARRLKNRFAPEGIVLLYHRVAEVGADPWSLCVTPSHFAEHLEVLQKDYHPVPLGQLAQDIQDGKRPHQQVAITFDDGYADNLYNAKPLLERYNIPATVFVAFGHLGRKREFWSDELERILLQPGTLPETLRLDLSGSTYHWKLGEAAHYSEEKYQLDRGWSALGDSDPSSRHALYRSLYQQMRSLEELERSKVLDELLAWSGTESLLRPTHRFLSQAEVFSLGQGGLIEIGSHTVNHPFLSALSIAAQQQEIQQSKALLEETSGQPMKSFAYPHGDYTAQTVALVREAGFNYACSTMADVVWRGCDHLQLPRLQVLDWDGEEFARQLSKWFRF